MHAATTEARRLSDCIKPRDRLARRIKHPALQIGPDTAEALAADDEFTNRNQGQCLWVIDRLEFAEPDTVPAVFAQVSDTAQLFIIHQLFASSNRGVITT